MNIEIKRKFMKDFSIWVQLFESIQNLERLCTNVKLGAKFQKITKSIKVCKSTNIKKC